MIECKNGKVTIDGELPEIMTDVAVVLVALIRTRKEEKSFLYMCLVKTILTAMEQVQGV